ncbi:hypothetical protein EI94DRAFT_1702947 [Lactarius quietus]|nr:hypothetical protein EI94DRAFT_1702947 [Lactarius quietus]
MVSRTLSLFPTRSLASKVSLLHASASIQVTLPPPHTIAVTHTRTDIVLRRNLLDVPGIFWEEASPHTLYDASFSRPLLILVRGTWMLLADRMRPTDSGPEFLPEVQGLRRQRPGARPDGWIPSVAGSAPAGKPAAAHPPAEPDRATTMPPDLEVALGTPYSNSTLRGPPLPAYPSSPDTNTEIVIGPLQLTLRKDDGVDGTTVDTNAPTTAEVLETNIGVVELLTPYACREVWLFCGAGVGKISITKTHSGFSIFCNKNVLS